MSGSHDLRLAGFAFDELFQPTGLTRLDQRFQDRLRQADPDLQRRMDHYRAGVEWPAQELSAFLLALAQHVEAFIGELFGIEAELATARERTLSHEVVFDFRREYVAKRGRRYRRPIERSFAELDAWLTERVGVAPSARGRERAVAAYGMDLLGAPEANADAIATLTQWCALGLSDPQGQAAVGGWSAFKLPRKTDYAQLVPLEVVADDPAGRRQGHRARSRRRDGFRLTDERASEREALAEVDYCIYCHEHAGDFCSKGFPERKGQPELGLKKNPLGEILTGCPLEEKISEMHSLKRGGATIAALAMAMRDNPMVAATGHRICNDCMKGCIYQKQDPVDIPQVETRVLTDVLDLPWGVEVYDLLTRWNPLRQEQWVMAPFNGRRVLVAGMGPAGFTMAHHLTMAGCAVVGIDGLKVEPLPHEVISGPIRDYRRIRESLDERVLAGFGGVAEYGITVRWDKNFLKLVYLTLLRRPRFQIFGGVRLGGTITVEDAWELGFDHVCIATGAGEPRVISMGNSLARGMRQANDFLMALQLTGAAKATSLANLQVRLPAVVIGGGLTAIDTATEVQAYYIAQVEKVLERYEGLAAARGEASVRKGLNGENAGILDEFLAHGRAVRAERARAAAAGEAPDFTPLLHQWGGVTIAYRRSLNESPAYLRNHEEVVKAMEEGIHYAEGLDPRRALLDPHGHVEAMEFRRRHRSEDGRWLETWTKVVLPARSVFVAAGASPNTIYEGEHPGTFKLDGNHFRPHVAHADILQPVRVADHCKAGEFGPLTSYGRSRHHVTFLGDTHPVFHGSVVKAIASSARSYPHVLKVMENLGSADPDTLAYRAFRAQMEHLFTARVVAVDASHPAVVELWVRAPMAARKFRPGQFFRLQTFETGAPTVAGTRIQIPVATVSGAGVAGDKVRLLLLRWGSNPEIAARFRPGEPIVLMGPTGAPARLPEDKTLMVVAGAWGGAVMLDLGPALLARRNRVLYFAAYPSRDALFRQDELECAADQIVWCTAGGEAIEARRESDASVMGSDMIQIVQDYGAGRIPRPEAGIDLGEVDEVLVMGSTGLLKGMQRAMRDDLRERFRPDVEVVGTVGSPMQCMLKGVCAQCLQWQVDPETGERTRAVFSCAQQDQPLHWIDVDNLAARQGQNRLAEHLTNLWLGHLLAGEA
jgi:NADPH-dependent glutamate synthase beta subunit-like oxidoreductase/NAD(P)H-flavin reductase